MSTAQNPQLPVVINEAVRLERDAKVGWVVLTRPGQINAINDDVRQGVPQALALLQKDPEIRVIVIRGEGERGFCAGGSFDSLYRGKFSALESLRSRFPRRVDRRCARRQRNARSRIDR